MLEATMHALRHPAYAERYQRTKRRLGRQRGAKVAQIDIARKLTEAIWHMLTTNQLLLGQLYLVTVIGVLVGSFAARSRS